MINKVFKSKSCARDKHKACRYVCRACFEQCMCSCHVKTEPSDDLHVVAPILSHHKAEGRAA